jgi:hypothetical protein
MKKISKMLLMSAAVMALVLPLSASAKSKAVDPVAGKYKNLFVAKAERDLVGGRVEILSANGEVIATQVLQKRKMFIDFSDVKEGVYTIRVSKGNNVKEFQFEK